MSLFTDYLASLSVSSSAPTEAAQKAAKVKAEAEARAARSALLVQRADAEEAILVDAGLDSDYQELLEVEVAIAAQLQVASDELAVFANMSSDAAYAVKLVEDKAQAIESLVAQMEAQGLLQDQVTATKQAHLDAALASHVAAKATKDRIAKLLANKKIK
jgi:hypothetical protein